jgi:leucyl aminopeptidase
LSFDTGRKARVLIEVTHEPPETQTAELLALPFAGSQSSSVRRIDEIVEGRLSRLIASGEAKSEPGATALVHSDGLATARIMLVGVGDGAEDDVRTAAASAARAARSFGGTLVWVLDGEVGLDPEHQARAVVEGVLIGGHDPARWKTTAATPRLERLLIATAADEIRPVVARAEVVARWTNRARELVDAPPNEMTPGGLAHAAATLLESTATSVAILEPEEIELLGLGALAVVGAGSVNTPRLIVLRYRGGGRDAEVLGLVGKAITFDSGGFFLKPQSDIVRQKTDMGGGAAVIAAVGAIAELGLPLDVLAVVPAAENMLSGGAYRPGDIIKTAAGLTVEVTNPDAEGRLVLADALWYARREGATHLIDIATLTGAMRAGMGDLYAGVFANDEDWRSRIVAAGDASGDYAWPWPLHPRYGRLLDSTLADLKNTAGRTFGYPIIAAAFLERFVDEAPWAHIDIASTAYLDEERDYFARGATGAGVRLLTELAARMASGAA